MFRASLRPASRDLSVSPAAVVARTLHSRPQRSASAPTRQFAAIPLSRICLAPMPVCHPRQQQLAVWLQRMTTLLQPQRRWMASSGGPMRAVLTEPLATGRSNWSLFALQSGQRGLTLATSCASKINVGRKVVLQGWVHRSRMMGPLLFVVLRDGLGFVQARFETSTPEQAALLSRAQNTGLESVVCIEGVVAARPEKMRNPDMPTGAIEIAVSKMLLLNNAATPPFTHGAGKPPNEETRLRYRYLDLRSAQLQRNIRLRSKVAMLCRNHLVEKGFVEIETPTLFRATPEGAREFIVPTRQPGRFYALPQSPQQYKQLLMSGGLDKYFQIARCYRDEDLRADRQPEFTQLDLEMSFITPEHIYTLLEGLMIRIWKQALNIDLPSSFPRMRFAEALARYGTDKPDVRYGAELKAVTALFRSCQPPPPPLDKVLQHPDGHIIAFNAKGLADLPGGAVTAMEEEARKMGAKIVLQVRGGADNATRAFGKHLQEATRAELCQQLQAENGDLIFIAASTRPQIANWALGKVRVASAAHWEQRGKLSLPRDMFRFLWVVDFPLFDVDDEGKLVSNHHPFTAPVAEDLPLLDSNPRAVRGLHYDLVLNGVEVGGGSIRVHQPELQVKIMRQNLALSEEQVARFSHLLEALKYGCPPHGGLALGFDRLMALLCGAASLKDVIAFPKSAAGNELLTGAPSLLSKEELAYYGLKTV